MLRSPIFALVILATSCVAAGREIPLSEIVSTVHQDGMQYISSGRRIVDGKTVEEDYAVAMEALSRDKEGSSNVFIATGGSVGDAIKATQRVFAGFHSADNAVSAYGVDPSNYWLAVYLGCGSSSPLRWDVQGVSVYGNTIRMTYRRPKSYGGTEDVVRYYYWTPIGVLDDGAYNLELYDADLKAVTLMRRVEVKRR
jgi:hypothetical protein